MGESHLKEPTLFGGFKLFQLYGGKVDMGCEHVDVLFGGGVGDFLKNLFFVNFWKLKKSRRKVFRRFHFIKAIGKKVTQNKVAQHAFFTMLFICLSGKTKSKTPFPSHANNSVINVLPFLDSVLSLELDYKSV